MTKPLLSEELRRHDLLAIATRVVTPTESGEVVVDADGIPVLADAIEEAGWRHPMVMPIILRMDINPPRPRSSNRSQRKAWERNVQAGYDAANNAWDVYAGNRPDWAKAVLAVLLFGEWAGSKRSTGWLNGTRSPWAMIRKNVRQYTGRIARRYSGVE